MPKLPALVPGETRHRRRVPFDHALRVPNYMWLFDSAQPPKLLFGRWRTADHFGGKGHTFSEAISHFAQSHGESVVSSDRLLTLTTPRSLGHVFNPLSVHYCIDTHEKIRWAILEVHNTYGGRHAYLLHPTEKGDAGVEKAFYVSPFFEVRGDYEVRVQLSADRVMTVVNLHQDGGLVFSASFTGVPTVGTVRNRIKASLRFPFASYQTSLRIRIHGVWLWLRRLPVIKRLPHRQQEGML